LLRVAGMGSRHAKPQISPRYPNGAVVRAVADSIGENDKVWIVVPPCIQRELVTTMESNGFRVADKTIVSPTTVSLVFMRNKK
jgi:hypothetical protein